MPVEIIDDLYFTQYGNGETSHYLIIKGQILQIKLFEEINSFPIIIHIFVNFKVLISTSQEIPLSINNYNAL